MIVIRWILAILFYGALILGCKSDEKSEDISMQKVEKQVPAGDISFSVPEGWVKETPSNQMRRAQYKIPGIGGAEDAEMALFVFPGTGGSVDANLNRWYGQFKQNDARQTADKAEIKKTGSALLPVTIIYVTGTYLKPKTARMMGGPVEEKLRYAMMAAIVETGTEPWFFKAVGPQKTIDHWRASFNSFAENIKYSKGG